MFYHKLHLNFYTLVLNSISDVNYKKNPFNFHHVTFHLLFLSKAEMSFLKPPQPHFTLYNLILNHMAELFDV